MATILPIVEGDGDMLAVPDLIRRVAHARGHFDIHVNRPHKRGDMPKALARFDDYLRVALLEECPILWVMDYDCETCGDVERDLRMLNGRAAAVGGGFPVAFALMVREFESLFIADETATRRVFADIPKESRFPTDPERIRDAKGWISSARPKGSAYKPTLHQAKLTALVDLDHLRVASASFRRFELAVIALMDYAD